MTLKSNVDNIETDYQNTNGGLLGTRESFNYTNKYLKNVLEENDKIKEIDSDLENLIEKLD